MGTEAWLWIGTAAGTVLFVLVPALVPAWYVLEQMIGGEDYPPV